MGDDDLKKAVAIIEAHLAQPQHLHVATLTQCLTVVLLARIIWGKVEKLQEKPSIPEPIPEPPPPIPVKPKPPEKPRWKS
jgi:hypothetical protein